MNPRRSFLALVGGTAFTGIARTGIARQPTLILPPDTVLPVARSFGLFGRHPSLAHAVAHCQRTMPPAVFSAWMESGLRYAALFEGRART